MLLLLLYAIFLFAATLLSARIQRSVLSTSVIFLLGGFIAGPAVLDVAPHDTQPLEDFIEAAMVMVLYTDGMRVDLSRLRRNWRLPAAALGIGMPLTILFTGLAAHFLVGLDWPRSLLLGAILSPTDPVFASALVGRKEVPRDLRDLLNVESGLNDGLALPAVWVLVSVASARPAHWGQALVELAGGVAIGIVFPWLALRLENLEHFRSVGIYQTIRGVAIGLIVFGIASLLQANTFIAAFAAGVTVAANDPSAKSDFRSFGETSSELLKLAGVMGFASLISPGLLTAIPLAGYGFALVVLLLVRPLSIGPTLIGSGFSWRSTTAAVWFGPKGFASLFYAIFALRSLESGMNETFDLTALVVAGSMVAHSSTDVLMANWLQEAPRRPQSREAAAALREGTSFATSGLRSGE
jgi:NhaP-type Na+/H+ or K+/H+ antiporter